MSDTATITITPEQFIAEVRKVAAERPDHVYENPEWSQTNSGLRGFCKYMHGDEPGCIMGTAAYNLGHTLSEGGSILEVLSYEVNDLYAATDSAQRGWLAAVQHTQDNGKTWAESVVEADRRFPNV